MQAARRQQCQPLLLFWQPGGLLRRVALAWQRINFKHCILAVPNLALVTLRQPEVDVDGINIFKIDNVRSVFQVIAHVHLADAHDAAERGHNSQARSRGFGQRQLGLSHLHAGSTFIQRSLTDEILRNQFLIAFF